MGILLANKAFTVTDGLTSQLFVIAFVHLIYMWIALICCYEIMKYKKTFLYILVKSIIILVYDNKEVHDTKVT